MSLHKSRKIISIILTVLIACGSIFLFGTLITKATVMSESYTSYVFNKAGVNESCKKAFSNQVKVLEAQSGIPARVFNSVYNFDDTSGGTAIERLFSSSNATLNTNSQTEKFEKLCKEYLEGNNMQYDEQLIHNTAVKATKAYSDCFGMKNTEQISTFIQDVNNHYQSYLSIGALLFIVPTVLFIILFRRSLDVAFNLFSALTISGMTFITSGIASLIAKVGLHDITPQIYQQAFYDCVKGACFVSIVFGVLLTAISVFANVKITKELDRKSISK